MRIAYITYELPPDIPKGGIGTYTLQAAALMHAAGNAVHIFAASPGRNESEIVNGIGIHRIKCSTPAEFTEKLLPVFSREHTAAPFDVAECPEIHGNGKLVKKAFPALPMIVRLHGPGQLVESLKKTYTSFAVKARFNIGAYRRGRFDKTWGYYDKESDHDYKFVQLADLITAPSEAMKEWAVREWAIHPDKIKVIANPFAAPQALTALPAEDTLIHKNVLFFGRLNVLKGAVNFAKAMGLFLKRNTDWNVTVIGDDEGGPYNESSMRVWMEKELAAFKEQVTFHPGMPQQELYGYIAQAGIVILPSLFETFSYTCAEAMAAGKPIVGSSNGGMNDLLEKGKAGICINPMNANEIADAVSLLATDHATRNKLAHRARTIMQSNKYTDEVTALTTTAYTMLISEKIHA